MKIRTLLYLVLAAICMPLTAAANSIIVEWNNVALKAVRDVKFGPPQTARLFAILHTATYDAWACYDEKAVGTVFYGFLRRPEVERTDANRIQAISFAAYRVLADIFPAAPQIADFDAKMTALGFDKTDVSTVLSTPQGIGNFVSTALIQQHRFDGSNQTGNYNGGTAYSDYTGYVPTNIPIPLTGPTVIADPNLWSPLQFSDGAGGFKTPGYLAPHWGNVKPFALKSSSQFRPRKPARVGQPLYKAQAELVIRVTAALDDTRKCIAEYWADGPASETPPGHWQLFAQFVSNAKGYGINEDTKLFFILGNAVNDAGIATWEAKRFYNSVRPIGAIRFLKVGKTIPTWGGTPAAPATVLGENWKPYQPDTFLTPPFPEHTSGHSCFSASAAYILKAFTGKDTFGNSVTIAANSSKFQVGVPANPVTLTWPTFTAASNEAALSRLYGGIHFAAGNNAGRKLGGQVGKAVYLRSLGFINGTAKPGVN